MVYSEKFVAVIVVGGKILREIRTDGNDEIRIPFGTEYSIRFKNLNSTRVAVSVHIDGDDALNGSRIVIGPNEEHELEGFMQGSSIRNRFKFIEKTDKISKHRGDHIDDGIVRIEYQFEKKPKTIKNNYTPSRWDGLWPNGGIYHEPDHLHPYTLIGGEREFSSSVNCSDNSKIDLQSTLQEKSEDGITVKGSQTFREYNTTYLKEMEEAKHVITFHLKGSVQTDQARKRAIKVIKPLYTKQKITCSTCGKKSKSNCRFCHECGTSLI